jgi:hypothetical protein
MKELTKKCKQSINNLKDEMRKTTTALKYTGPGPRFKAGASGKETLRDASDMDMNNL